MKILLYSSKFPPQVGGVENVLKYLDRYFSKTNTVGVVTSLILENEAKGMFQKVLKGLQVQKKSNTNVSYHFMSLPRSIFGAMSFVYRFPVSVYKIRSRIKNFSPDIINAHFLDDSLYYFYFATWGVNIPVVLDIHGNELHMFTKGTLYRFFMQKVITNSSKIIVHSDYMKKELEKFYEVEDSKVFIVPNGVDTNHFTPLKNNKPVDYFLYVGRFDKKKGIEVLLKAYKSVESKLTKGLVLVGDGRGEEGHGKLSAKVLSTKYKSKKIKFTGLIPNDRVVSYYSSAYYTVFPSLHEPFGIVALESMSMGIPFIASSGGFEEIAKSTNCGITFKPGSVKQLSKVLLKVDSDLNLREALHKNCKREIKKYKWENIANQYLEVFKL